jgi:hypothetical protein
MTKVICKYSLSWKFVMTSLRNFSVGLIASGLLLGMPFAAQAKGGGHGGGAHATGAAHSETEHSESNVGGNATGYYAAKAAIAAQKERQESEHGRRYGGGRGGRRGYPYPYNDGNTTSQQFTNSLDSYNQSQDAQRAALPTTAFVHEYHWPKTYSTVQTAQSAPINRAPASVPNSVDLAVNVLGSPVQPLQAEAGKF